MMATARFSAAVVLDHARRADEKNEAKRIEAREAAITELIKQPKMVGVWPFRREHWRTREEAERDYALPACDGWEPSSEWVVERRHWRKRDKLRPIIDLAAAAVIKASDDMVELSPDEATLIGLHIDGAAE
ncbi:hypothetical protein [Consotaella salsifontis]|uniref:Uncharacterized protein n=1 Tax=Consotaella salsifontis TaxID=1365950 RepID=A0A1T4SRT0_9HYPH|nr:hypothetical protein [Consotaella salsifontis]SKA30887.1 hypothetical protein SAMN05428963_11381 [Consotaella salsifontis]